MIKIAGSHSIISIGAFYDKNAELIQLGVLEPKSVLFAIGAERVLAHDTRGPLAPGPVLPYSAYVTLSVGFDPHADQPAAGL
jgi:hypothetical protein